LAPRLQSEQRGGHAMNELVWNLGLVSVGTGVLTVLAALGFGIYILFEGFETRH
jgi:hypothetical protein